MTEYETVTRAIRAHVGAPADPTYPFNDFVTPELWRVRGEQYGRNAVVIVVHDGGHLAPHFNYAYEDRRAMEAMRKALAACVTPEAPRGYWAEQCTSWYTAIYRA